MTTAAGFPPESLLLYVPPRKSQAKGIDTFVLDPSGVVTLGEHPAVREEARRLSEAYTGLWRLLLFVHPACAHDARGLSQATDAFVRAVWSESVGYADPPRDATWFDYLSRDLREPVQDSAG
jgi:hypothetical protein